VSGFWWCGRREIFVTTARRHLAVGFDGDYGDETKSEEGALHRLHVDVKGLKKKNKFILSRK
jgi:hypothetical protein